MAFKILSDFDGVWTDPIHEAVEVEARFVTALAHLTGLEVGAVRADVAHCKERALSQAELHGWKPGGRLTAYADEDAFLAISGIASYLETSNDARVRTYREARRREEGPDFMTLADHAFQSIGDVAGLGHLLPDGPAVLRSLEELGCDIVVVSNSHTSKLARLFGAAGIDAGPDRGHRVRVRGGARKWALGETGTHIDVRGRRVCVDRPDYARIIQEERPDLIVGDVFSLDLALPFHMRAIGHRAAPRVLVHRPPTKATSWVASHVEHGHVDAVAPRLVDMPLIVERAIEGSFDTRSR